MSIADEIEKLSNLMQNGAISEEEYQKAKETLLRQQESIGLKFSDAARTFASNVNTWSMFIHLSVLCIFILPLFGLIVPIILWQVRKDESQVIDRHGRIVVNWIITAVILGGVFWMLCRFFIGIPLLAALIILSIVFPIIGGIKANNGEVWPYPYSIKIFPVE
jgi:uncharacterized protein